LVDVESKGRDVKFRTRYGLAFYSSIAIFPVRTSISSASRSLFTHHPAVNDGHSRIMVVSPNVNAMKPPLLSVYPHLHDLDPQDTVLARISFLEDSDRFAHEKPYLVLLPSDEIFPPQIVPSLPTL
jgi:hypothetical protein